MKKIHTKEKRKFGLPTHLRHYKFFHPNASKNRPKTFKTKESADKWAAAHGLKSDSYSLKSVKRNKKFMIVVKNGTNKTS